MQGGNENGAVDATGHPSSFFWSYFTKETDQLPMTDPNGAGYIW